MARRAPPVRRPQQDGRLTMRVLHFVKTSEGARWAAFQATELVKLGVDVHVVLPSRVGASMEEWRRSGATLHVESVGGSPALVPRACRMVRQLVADVQPDLIHTHFVRDTLLVRAALGRRHPIPRVFQVPGPLHLEHGVFRAADLATAGPNDAWIGSSRCIVDRYRRAGVPARKLFLSYYGTRPDGFGTTRRGQLRKKLGVPDGALLVGNVSFIYPPKYYLGQRIGLKCHEDLIDALGMLTRERSDVFGVLVGGGWGSAGHYERRLRTRARVVGAGRIHMPGYVSPTEVESIWADFDCAIHAPLSENCGGAVEPLLSGVPTIAARVGGLPELVIDSLTGTTVSPRRPAELAAAARDVLSNLTHHRGLAERGRALVSHMFDVRRTAAEVHQIYRHVLEPSCAAPAAFDSLDYARHGCDRPMPQYRIA